jgi:hypothetical protein
MSTNRRRGNPSSSSVSFVGAIQGKLPPPSGEPPSTIFEPTHFPGASARTHPSSSSPPTAWISSSAAGHSSSAGAALPHTSRPQKRKENTTKEEVVAHLISTQRNRYPCRTLDVRDAVVELVVCRSPQRHWFRGLCGQRCLCALC